MSCFVEKWNMIEQYGLIPFGAFNCFCVLRNSWKVFVSSVMDIPRFFIIVHTLSFSYNFIVFFCVIPCTPVLLAFYEPFLIFCRI